LAEIPAKEKLPPDLGGYQLPFGNAVSGGEGALTVGTLCALSRERLQLLLGA